MIGIDPHKASWTAAAVGPGLQLLATIRVPVDPQGYRDLRRFATRWPGAIWAIEGAAGLGAPLATRLAADGIAAVDVPAKLAARVRVLSTGHGRKNDDADAISVAVAARSAAGLRTVTVDETVTALRALVEHRDDVVKTRTQTVNRLHVLLTQLLPGGAPRQLTADAAAQLLRPVRPRGIGPRTLRRLAADLVTEIRHLDRRITAANTEIADAVQASRSTLTELRGIGDLTAGKILARVGDVHRFRSAAAFASYTGTAPIEVSSGDVVRHRLSRAGDRQLNCCLHTMAITQIQRDSPGRAYYLRKRADGKSHKEALRCLKRRLSDAVYRCLIRDAEQQNGADPGGHQGATTKSSAAGSTPTTGSSDKSLPGPATTDPTT
ncbi:IS110 family transposase [Pseudonocardia sp.]|uniref:IS110 family transposase n=1 Tax=Pseudonocardia sp. TaxID=60912 RepID=UPI0031FCA325